MEEPSEKVDPMKDPETPQKKDEEDALDDTDVLQPETLVKVMKKLTLNPGVKRSARRRSLRNRIAAVPVENKSEKIRREVQSAFPKRRVRTLLSVLKDPIAKMRRLVRIEQRQKRLEGNEFERDSEPFRCLCTFCHYQRWDPSENAKIGKN
ncbi:developmental pluripotency-associated protein 3 [Mus musculus]|uniref:Developmental pluripotency-associated protein 3 n=1 Tax=Mus musculus TaxID=10090 RepID=DPPA3_MOUSE|nr:developmental pluripotency-associated protein 3 [Mus musculus]Q8QZY3.1 RecName: Full=Developmental pluripotency-associated protein 3; AltName: Full=Compaction-associated protein 1; AltName: Full=Primordial germ cell protein 7; AltName: Full=Stella [Mus musculus]AAH99433.1 Developmental pluripotency-associated 3 [Mus musculus]AAI00332.1 Developmental pluripotency-associated 3 [Mus musculus]AAI07341.1 Developmental pluripotency-associated 3 [Mus musculus]AAI07342.1 Developmental pluripotency-|eukprot:NP_631964.1 developmental pluripotency-associated protein 3 [Mus musculus]